MVVRGIGGADLQPGAQAMGSEKEKGPVDEERAYARLSAALRADSLFDRQEAVKALAQLGGRRAVEPLLTALANDHELVASVAAEALAAIGDARTVAALIDHCLRYKPEGSYRNNPQAPYEEQRRARLDPSARRAGRACGWWHRARGPKQAGWPRRSRILSARRL
jgi:HEAT repeats